eukprot:919531-Pleurochrysis_carterae.AAC.1
MRRRPAIAHGQKCHGEHPTQERISTQQRLTQSHQPRASRNGSTSRTECRSYDRNISPLTPRRPQRAVAQ